MNPLPFVLIAFAAAAACLVSRGRPGTATAIGLGALVVLTMAALLISPGAAVRVGAGDVLVGTAYARLFLVLACLSGLLVALIGLATIWPANLLSAILVTVGGIGLALSTTDPLLALVVLLASGLIGSLAGLADPLTASDVGTIAGSMRLIVLAGALAIGAIAWASPSLAGVGGDPQEVGLAELAIVLAVALRFGMIPFHRPVARLADSAPAPTIPLLLVWGPAALAVVVVGATSGPANPLVPSGIGQAMSLAIAAATLVFGAVGGWLQDDLEHVVGYSIVQDAGFVLLGLTVVGTTGGEATLTWLLILVVAKTAFAGWATVVQARFRTARLPELSGWARRSPLLGLSLVGIALATIGLPGLLAWQVRWALIDGAADGPLAFILLLGGLASLAYYGRIVAIGSGPVSMLVGAAPGGRPVAPQRGRSAAETVRTGWLTNRGPIATGLVVLLVAISLVVAVGGLGGPEAARAAGPLASPVQPVASPSQ